MLPVREAVKCLGSLYGSQPPRVTSLALAQRPVGRRLSNWLPSTALRHAARSYALHQMKLHIHDFRISRLTATTEGSLPYGSRFLGSSTVHLCVHDHLKIASKVICDDTYSNKSWSIVGRGDDSGPIDQSDGVRDVSAPGSGDSKKLEDRHDIAKTGHHITKSLPRLSPEYEHASPITSDPPQADIFRLFQCQHSLLPIAHLQAQPSVNNCMFLMLSVLARLVAHAFIRQC
ncbi:hypothetical protein PILCRDRAFT_13297 [Piloderma croceum F 1598]|uniref:Uncharacterized protein n=1 Tax=Piloderma croceum (strain F 1598) TaxID=765440 RepID=A0A0C3F7B4_PILCF|nr:hypothetical protein PILCRDRAFT_13297 [Piloderma croceum F 1598]